MKMLIGGSPCTHWSIAQTKNRETEARASMVAAASSSSVARRFRPKRSRWCMASRRRSAACRLYGFVLSVLTGPLPVYARFSHQVGLFRSAWWAQFSASQFSASQLSQNTRWKSSSHGPDRIGRAPRKSPRASGEAVILSKLFTARPPLCGGPHPPGRSTRPAPIPLPSRNRLSVLR